LQKCQVVAVGAADQAGLHAHFPHAILRHGSGLSQV
jgi:hypothetical protein